MKIVELSADDPVPIWPIMSQLRGHIDEITFKHRLDEARDNGYRLLAAYDSDKLVGLAGFRIITDLCWGRTLYVDDLVVDEKLRSIGIGKELIYSLCQIANSLGCIHVRLASGLTREQTHGFYRHMGFRSTSLQFVRAFKSK